MYDFGLRIYLKSVCEFGPRISSGLYVREFEYGTTCTFTSAHRDTAVNTVDTSTATSFH